MKIISFCIMLVFACSCATINSERNVKVSKNSLRVASVQFPIEGKKTYQEFAKKVQDYVFKAQDKKVELIVFPELFSLDLWPIGSRLKDRSIVENIAKHSKKLLHSLVLLSKKYQLNILAGSLPVVENQNLYNRTYYIKSTGEVSVQDKLTLTPWGKKVGFTTGRKLQTVETEYGRVALLICYDAESPQISSELTKSNIDLILVPSMTESEEGFRRVSSAAKTRAIEHHAYVVVSGTVGTPEEQWKNIGQAGFFNPQYPGYPPVLKLGEKNKAGLTVFDLDFEKLRKTKNENRFYPAKEKLAL